jgi:hypothetical protein
MTFGAFRFLQFSLHVYEEEQGFFNVSLFLACLHFIHISGTKFLLLFDADHIENTVSPVLLHVGTCLLSRCLAMFSSNLL